MHIIQRRTTLISHNAHVSEKDFFSCEMNDKFNQKITHFFKNINLLNLSSLKFEIFILLFLFILERTFVFIQPYAFFCSRTSKDFSPPLRVKPVTWHFFNFHFPGVYIDFLLPCRNKGHRRNKVIKVKDKTPWKTKNELKERNLHHVLLFFFLFFHSCISVWMLQSYIFILFFYFLTVLILSVPVLILSEWLLFTILYGHLMVIYNFVGCLSPSL